MPWPTPQDYREAVQSPNLAFSDPELRAGQAELDALGLPRPISGGFACVYKIQCGSNVWAARCFLSEVTDQQQRYEAISRHLASARLPYTVPFTYLPKGIMVQGRIYPLLKMAWVQGESLGAYVSKNAGNPAVLRTLADRWVKMIVTIQGAGIAHGDLQHGNILVVNNELRLIDYDGMFVPGLKGRTSREVGHRNYQHPGRTEFDYDQQLDNFAAWVIWFSLLALSVHPELWRKYRGGDECILFRKEDFLDPSGSGLFHDLSASSNGQIRTLTKIFTSLQNFPPLDVPALDGSQTPILVTPPQTVQKSSTEWWKDHVEQVKRGEEVATATASSKSGDSAVPDLTWIFNSDDSVQKIERLGFTNGLAGPRGMLLASLTLTIITLLASGTPAWAIIVASFGVAGLSVIFCFSRYRRDPSVQEKAAFTQSVNEFMQKVKAQQTVIDSILAERTVLSQEFAGNESKSKAQENWQASNFQANVNRSQAKLNSQLQSLDQKRRGAIAEEARDLQSLQQTIGEKIANLDRQLASLSQHESDQRRDMLQQQQRNFVEQYLRAHRIEDASIPQIGPGLVRKMAMENIYTAFEAEKWRVLQVRGIGHFKADHIKAWRDQLETRAKMQMPRSLSLHDDMALKARFASHQQQATEAKNTLEANLRSQISACRARSAAVRRACDEDEQRFRNACEEDNEISKANYDLELVGIRKEMAKTKADAEAKIAKLTSDLSAAQRQIFALHFQSARNDHQMKRFDHLTFRNFLLNVVGLN